MAAPASYPPECLGPQHGQGGQQLRVRSPCFKLKAMAILWPLRGEGPSPLGATLYSALKISQVASRVVWAQTLWKPCHG